jgi:hypothetical protein
MVTLILAFIFLTPHLWSYGDHPQPEKLAAGNVLVKRAGPQSYVYDIPAGAVNPGSSLGTQLQQEIQSVSGAVVMDRYQALKEPRGKITAYRVWAHR